MGAGPSGGFGNWDASAQLARDTIALQHTQGIPTAFLHVMDHTLLEQVAAAPSGAYRETPESVYLKFQQNIGACFCDQWIPTNPLTMSEAGYDSTISRGATTGLAEIVVDGVVIDSPEAVVDHMEDHLFPSFETAAADLDLMQDALVNELIRQESYVQELFGRDLLKVPYDGFQRFPRLQYGLYGYENYFMAYALYPEVMERGFMLEANLAVKHNALAARAIVEGGLPRVVRLDHDMTDSRGTLADPKTLDQMWFPQFARSIQPLLDAGIRLLWHCDGNVTPMIPRLIECGIGGFQGFQYEDGVDYEAICKMTDRQGNPLMIWAGVSVTRTLPMGTKDDVRAELQWLVDNGPRVGLFLGASSSIIPATNRENVKALVEVLAFYREKGRA
ncbi:MAG: hypothetical protein JXQ73_00495 [Phycisphaerae bacterium]|nr:hypothetical protein [Phycisphaerae bacterium]